ncbi:MAG: dimethyl sulfoxide reductase anchor subunit [Propionicimonas sp.]
MTDARGQFAFTFDQGRCTGCKACQIACKDDNRLPVGVTWRRVYESSGGALPPEPVGLAAMDVFTYYTSMSCNHCTDPICVSVCPSTAMHKGEAGLVLVDPGVCIGCGYCAMACPYEAPQYRADLGIMSKCDGCLDRVEQGLSPACVAACPTRALGFEFRDQPVQPPPRIEPLPDPGLTRPNLVLEAHPRALAVAPDEVSTITRAQPDLLHEAPLAAFTVLVQVAAGLVAMLGLTMPWGEFAAPLPLVATIVAGVLLGIALVVSTSHLGSPQRAMNALRNLRTSWLSREIAITVLFGGAPVLLCGALLLWPEASPVHVVLAGTAGLTGVTLVLVIGRVYTLRTVPAWNSRHTTIGFLVTAGAAGSMLLAMLAGIDAGGSASTRSVLYLVGAGVLLAGQWARARYLRGLASGSSAARLSFEILTVSHPRLRSMGHRSGWGGAATAIAAALAAVWSPLLSVVLGAIALLLLVANQSVLRLFFYRSMIREGR